jgi:SAM-dependent methyltransferase
LERFIRTQPVKSVLIGAAILMLAGGLLRGRSWMRRERQQTNQQQVVCEMHRVLRPEGRLMIIDGYRDRLWERLIYDWCVAAVEGAVHHALARRLHDLFVQAGFNAVRQQAKLGLAPFLLTTGVTLKAGFHCQPVAGWRDVHMRLSGPQQEKVVDSFDRA